MTSLHFRLPAELHLRLEEIANVQDRSVSHALRAAVRDFVLKWSKWGKRGHANG